jgi:hypothetical protein
MMIQNGIIIAVPVFSIESVSLKRDDYQELSTHRDRFLHAQHTNVVHQHFSIFTDAPNSHPN